MGTGVYSIGAVSKMLGVPVATLRTWHERYGVVEPERSRGGHRLYARDQVEQLRFVSEHVSSGMSPGDAHRLLTESMDRSPTLVSVPAGGPILVLLAERDPFAGEFAEFFLKTEGYEVILSLDADDARQALSTRRPEVGVVDTLISGGSGLALCRLMRDDGIPVLAISTLEARDQALEAGAAAFLQKPLDPLVLASTMKDLLGRSAFLRTAAPVD